MVTKFYLQYEPIMTISIFVIMYLMVYIFLLLNM